MRVLFVTALLVAVALADPARPQFASQFSAKTQATRVELDERLIDALSTVYYDGVAQRFRADVYNADGVNYTEIIDCPAGKAYLTRPNVQCAVMAHGPQLDAPLAVPADATYNGVTEINGQTVNMWSTNTNGDAEVFYVTPDNTPVRIEVTSASANSSYIVDFLTYVVGAPDQSLFTAPAGCSSTEMSIDQVYAYFSHSGKVAQRLHYLPSRAMSLTHHEAFIIKQRAIAADRRTSRLQMNAGARGSAAAITANKRQSIDPATLQMIGKAAWQIIVDNKPQTNANLVQNAIVPQGTTWTDLEGFTQMKWPDFSWDKENLYGANVVSFGWEFDWFCRGSYNGLGSYIENAGAFERNMYAAWGYTVNVANTVLNPVNVGTRASPVASASILLTMNVDTLLNSVDSTCKVALQGDCGSSLLACDGYY